MRVEVERLYEDERGFTRVLARVASESKPGLHYGVYLWLRDGKIAAAYCTCPGYVFRQHCKHIEWVKNRALKLGTLKKFFNLA